MTGGATGAGFRRLGGVRVPEFSTGIASPGAIATLVQLGAEAPTDPRKHASA